MKKNILNLLLITSLSISGASKVFAQNFPQLVNGDMDQWENVGNSNVEPTQWNSFMSGDCSLTIGCSNAKRQRVERSTDVRPGSTGTYSARIWSTSEFGNTANGNLTTGRIFMGSTTAANSANNNKTITTDPAFRMPINEKPDSLVFWAKFIPKNNSTTDEARMRAVLHNNTNYRDPAGNVADEVGNATINYTRTHNGTSYVWRRISVPFDYSQGGSNTPVYMLITFTTNKTPGGGSPDDQVFIDDVQLIYNPRIYTDAISPLTYYVSSTAGASINVPYSISAPVGSVSPSNIISVELSNAIGSFANPTVIGTATSNVSGTVACTIPAGTPTGNGYRVRVKASNPQVIGTDNGANITIANPSVAVTPASSQSILSNAFGTTLTATEFPSGTAREWKYSLTSGGPYVSFTTPETNVTYDPYFTAGGNYYIICESQINGITYVSNEVEINVSSFSLTTGTIVGFPINLSASSNSVIVQVPFSTNGTAMDPGNIFTAQLSDPNGSFANPTNIGTIAAVTDDTIAATIPSNTPSGDHYRIRVIGSDPAVFGANNGSDLVVHQFSVKIDPAVQQTIPMNTNGSPLTATINDPNATVVWKVATISGGPYINIYPLNNTLTYVPNFPNLGTYYILAESKNALNDVVVSNEVEIVIINGSSITTTSIDDNIFYISPNAQVQTKVHFTSDLVFNAGNTFSVEMSDATGAFSTGMIVGTLSSINFAPIDILIPNNLPDGSSYRFRVISSDPAIVGSPIAVNSEVIGFEANVTPVVTQIIEPNTNGNLLTATSTHPNVYYQWSGSYEGMQFSDIVGANTHQYTPNFAALGQTDVRCKITNEWNDVVVTNVVMVRVEKKVGLNEVSNEQILIYQQYDQLMVDLSKTTVFESPQFSLTDMTGKVLSTQKINGQSSNVLPVQLPTGVYVYRIIENENVVIGKIVIR